MSDVRVARHTAVLASLFFLTFTNPSQAYVDPGSASVVITAILGGIAAVGYTTRLYWQRFKGLFRRGKQEPASK